MYTEYEDIADPRALVVHEITTPSEVTVVATFVGISGFYAANIETVDELVLKPTVFLA